MDILVEEQAGSLWVAALKDGRLEGLEVDPAFEEVRWGSIYWAKVARIDTSLDAAFVNMDGENIGLLHNADIIIKQDDGTYKRGGDEAIGKHIQPGDMIAIQAKRGYLPAGPDMPQGPSSDKNPRVSMNITLHGRYTVFAPFENENRISRRIEDKTMRKQLMDMLESMDDKAGMILRAAGAHTQSDILKRELKILKATWDQLSQYFEGNEPSIIMAGPDAIQRTISDQAHETIDRLEITTMDHFQDVEEWCELFAPDLVTKVKPVEIEGADMEFGLFELRDIIGQIEDLLQPYAILNTGGTLIIQETAALTVIDVNKATDDRSTLAVNTDAAKEIARQLRLRNMGGAIIIDFLKMKAADQKKLEKSLEDFLAHDPCTVQLHGFTKLGLMELTRNRRTPPLQERVETAMGQNL